MDDNRYSLSYSIRHSIFGKMLVFFVMIVVLPSIIIGIGASYIFYDVLMDRATISYESSLLNLETSLEKELFDTKMIANYMYLDLDLKEAISTYDDNLTSSIEASQRLKDKYDNYRISESFSNVNAIKIYGFNGYKMSFGDEHLLKKLEDSKVLESQYYNKAIANPDRFIWSGIETDIFDNSNYKTISIYRVIKDRSYTKDIGFLYMNLDARVYKKLTDNFYFSESNEIYILDNNNVTIGGEPLRADVVRSVRGNEDLLDGNYTVITEGASKVRHFVHYIDEFDWKIIGVLPVKEITEGSVRVFVYAGLSILVILVLSSLVWFIVLARIYEPVRKLTQATREIRKGNFDVKVDYASHDELGMLTSSFNFMVSKINDLMTEVVEENNRKRDAQYRALQAQINPHFLYNTLNSIRWLAIIQKAENIKKMIDALSGLLKNSTSKMDQYVQVSEEVDNLKDYVYIQKIAYSNKFDVIYELEDKALSCTCVKFILQPLVENAIFHGILPKKSFGTIWVNIALKANKLRIVIEDDGIGMSSEKLDQLLRGEDTKGKKMSGIGLSNVLDRLSMTYGDEAIYEVTSGIDSHTRIKMEIPCCVTSKDKE